MAKSKGSDERQVRLAELQARQRAADRRRSGVILGAAVALSVALIAVVAFAIVDTQQARNDVQLAAQQDIQGVEDFGEQTQDHVPPPVTYEQTPPVGGEHLGAWTNCGFYPSPVTPGSAVHSLEHGAVWVTYDPELPADQVAALEELSVDNPYLLVSPFEGLPSPVVASAWGLQLQLDDVDDERLPVFLVKYLQGAQTPEPGAACTGGVEG